MTHHHTWVTAKRVVIKIGSALLINHDGRLNETWLKGIADDIKAAYARGQEIILVSSGAVALGRTALGHKTRKLTLEESQAAAACGQITLVQKWQAILGAHHINVAQILLTPGDTEQRRRYLNARATLSTLLARGVVPIINENDTVVTEELRYGDNDRLAARVAAMMSADYLILLSDIDGLYRDFSPHTPPDPDKHIAVMENLTPDIWALAQDSHTQTGTGGMKTKLKAAEIAQKAGCHMLLTTGRTNAPLRAIAEGTQRYTLFRAKQNPHSARKSWIAGSLTPAGKLYIDAGAARALAKGNSLLPIGVKALEGVFERGDTLSIMDVENTEIARGLSAYNAQDALKIIGKNSTEIEKILRIDGRKELVHRDDLVMLDKM